MAKATTRIGPAEKPVPTSEQRLRALVMGTSDFLYTMSPDWTSMRFLEGAAPKGVRAARDRWLEKYIAPEDRPGVMSAVQDAIRTKTVLELEHRLRQEDGTLGWAISRAVPLLDDRGEVVEWFGVTRDITKRKRAEEALRASEERYRALFESMPEGLIVGRMIYDDQGRACDYQLVEANPAYERLTGLAREESLRQTMKTLIPTLEPSWVEHHARVAETGEAERWEAYNAHVGQHYEMYSYRPAPGMFASVFLNVTERKQFELRLQRQSDLLAAIIDNIPVLLVIWDAALQSFRFNRHMREVTGWTEADAADGRFMERVYPDPEYRRSVSEYMLSLAPGWRDLRTTTKDGSTIDISWANVALPDGGTIGIGIDVRERKAIEGALQANARMLDAVMEHVPLGIAICDADGRIIMSSRAGLALSGRTPGEELPTFMRHNEVFRRDGVTRVELDQLPLVRALRRGEVVIGEEILLSRPDGSRVPLLASAAPMWGDEGEIVGAVLAYQDITQRMHMEDRLRDTDRRKDEFIAILSHELRNPLAPIRYALPILGQQALGGRALQALSVVERQVDHLARLVDDLLDVSRITKGKIELRPEHVTLASIVKASVEAAAPAVAEASHTLRLEVPEEPIWVFADPARMSQVVTNLVNNSAKYTPRGGDILLQVGCEDGRAVIRVRDNGLGIAPELLPHLFEMFRQLQRPDGQGGLGIGLALARRLVEMHDGTIEARSAGVGQGAEFVVTLPLVEPVGDRSPAEERSAATRGGPRLRVLITDDNADLVEMLALLVETAGHEVRKAFDGPSAVSAALSFRPHVVLLDLGLPGMSGLDVARELRRHPETAPAKLVALTGWGQDEDRRKTRDAGFDHHLTKPTEPQELERLLAELSPR